jgi:hypothetical protein
MKPYTPVALTTLVRLLMSVCAGACQLKSTAILTVSGAKDSRQGLQGRASAMIHEGKRQSALLKGISGAGQSIHTYVSREPPVFLSRWNQDTRLAGSRGSRS